jgi:hypothetical protein
MRRRQVEQTVTFDGWAVLGCERAELSIRGLDHADAGQTVTMTSCKRLLSRHAQADPEDVRECRTFPELMNSK